MSTETFEQRVNDIATMLGDVSLKTKVEEYVLDLTTSQFDEFEDHVVICHDTGNIDRLNEVVSEIGG